MANHKCPKADDYYAINGEHLRDAKATCGNCRRSWCDRCDPTPSAMCHYCNGRGYSLAPLGRYRPDSRHRADAARQVWERQYADACRLVEPYAVTFPDGFVGLVGAPSESERVYSALLSVGYAKGWF